MNYNYQVEDDFIDYQSYHLDDWLLRGPKPDLSQPYFCCLGAAQTFGRYCQSPFAHLLSQKLGVGALNFGIPGASPTYFLNDKLLKYANQAEFVIVQFLSARSCSNSLFKNRSGCR